MNDSELLGHALLAREKAHCIYSGIAVGAALLTRDGKVFCGANIENASSPAGICAERVAIFEAVNHGEREFRKIAIVGGPWGKIPSKPFFPCGICRQVMSEFCRDDFEIIVSFGETYKKYSLRELLPHAFTEDAL